MADRRLLPDGIDSEGDPVPDAGGGDLDLAPLAVEDERHGNDSLEGVALGTAIGAFLTRTAWRQ